VAALFVISAALAMLLSALYVRYRDIAIIWSVAVTVLFYGTPILYPLEIVPDTVRDFILLNPLTPIFEQARQWIIDPDAPGAVSAAGGIEGLIAPALIYALICFMAVRVFSREAPRIAEEL
jgi:ABC-2 type transport system permease protein